MVDAPETDEITPARLVEQAKYFAITVPQAIEVGGSQRVYPGEIVRAVYGVYAHVRCDGPQQARAVLCVCADQRR